MQTLQAFACAAAIWALISAFTVLVIVPHCQRVDADPVEPVSRNLRNIHGDRGTSL